MRKILVLRPLLGVSLPGIRARSRSSFTAETDHYRIFSEASQSQAEDVSRRMEACLRLYNDIFHFDLALLPAKIRVRVFKDLGELQQLPDKVLSQTRTDFVFVACSDPEKSELLCFPKEEKASPPPSSTRDASSSSRLRRRIRPSGCARGWPRTWKPPPGTRRRALHPRPNSPGWTG